MPKSSPPVKTRTYDGSTRTAQAMVNRRRVVDAAHLLLLERGYAATTIVAVAARAAVSVDTVYKGFGSKAALTKAVYDVVLAGDDDPVPMAQRPGFLAIFSDPDPAGKVAHYLSLARQIDERLGPLVTVLLSARGADPDLESFASTIDAERLVGTTMFVEHLVGAGGLRPDVDCAAVRDVLWALISPEVYRLLVVERGWSLDAVHVWRMATMRGYLATSAELR